MRKKKSHLEFPMPLTRSLRKLSSDIRHERRRIPTEIAAQRASIRRMMLLNQLGRKSGTYSAHAGSLSASAYVAGARTSSEPLTFPVKGVDGGSVSMLAVRVG
jgi:hypothetical protein